MYKETYMAKCLQCKYMEKCLTVQVHGKMPYSASAWKNALQCKCVEKCLTVQVHGKMPYSASAWKNALRCKCMEKCLTVQVHGKMPYSASAWKNVVQQKAHRIKHGLVRRMDPVHIQAPFKQEFCHECELTQFQSKQQDEIR